MQLRGMYYGTLFTATRSSMKGATMLATLQRLGVIPSFSRPAVSDDNPYIDNQSVIVG
jgi:hypothetical protein